VTRFITGDITEVDDVIGIRNVITCTPTNVFSVFSSVKVMSISNEGISGDVLSCPVE
jgi:hypothetical protein